MIILNLHVWVVGQRKFRWFIIQASESKWGSYAEGHEINEAGREMVCKCTPGPVMLLSLSFLERFSTSQAI